MKRLVGFSILLFTASPALGQTATGEWTEIDIDDEEAVREIRSSWVEIATDNDKTVWKIRGSDLLNKTNANPTVWIVADHALDKTVSHRETKQLFKFNCQSGSYRTLKTVQYWANGSVKWQYSDTYSLDDYAPPDSMIEAALKSACPTAK